MKASKLPPHDQGVLGHDGEVVISTSAMFRFSKKLKNLKPLIRDFGRQNLENLTIRTKEAHQVLCEKQITTMANPSAETIQEEAEVYEKWLKVA